MSIAAAPPGQLDELSRPSGSRHAKNILARIAMWASFLAALIPLGWILSTAVVKGYRLLLTSEWWLKSQRNITTSDFGGGARHAIEGTLITGLVTAVIAVPIGILTAVYLVEYGRGPAARAVSFMVDILSGVPSIVAALFVYAVWVTMLDRQRVGFAVCLALVILMIPTIVRSTEEMLKLVPNELREAAYALGVPKWVTVTRIVLRTAMSGIITGVLLGLARVMGETAPLLILVVYSQSFNTNIFSGAFGTLPTMINNDRADLAMPFANERMWAAALTLILIILVLNVLGRVVAHFGSTKK